MAAAGAVLPKVEQAEVSEIDKIEVNTGPEPTEWESIWSGLCTDCVVYLHSLGEPEASCRYKAELLSVEFGTLPSMLLSELGKGFWLANDG